MIEFSCEFSVSLDEAHRRLKAAGCKHEVLTETTLAFRKRPTRQAKEILSDCGFTEDKVLSSAPLAEQLAALKERFS